MNWGSMAATPRTISILLVWVFPVLYAGLLAIGRTNQLSHALAAIVMLVLSAVITAQLY